MPPSFRRSGFDIPKGLSPLNNLRLNQTSLIEFYQLNRQDFFDVMSIRYFEMMDVKDRGALDDPAQGFDSFCDLMTQYLLAAPSETLVSARDEKGRYVNFFGEAILKHIGDLKLNAQQLYAHDAEEKYLWVEELVNVFVRYVAIDCFNRALSLLEEIDIQKARARIQLLRV